MIDPRYLDDWVHKVASSLPGGLQNLRQDLDHHLRAALEAGISHLNLVTREDFDVQSAVLARTRERLQQLEARVTELERQLGGGAG